MYAVLLGFAIGALASAMAGMVAVLGSIPGETSSSDNGKSISVVGEELENNEDIKEFNSNIGYGSETLVKEKSGDGVYVLGKTNTIQTASGEKSSFVPVDMDSYLEHNSPGKYLKSDLLALGNVAQETIISTGEMASYELENSTIIGPARHLYDGYKKVTGEAPFGGALEDFDVMKKAREKCSSISSDIHDYLYDMAPYKDEFNLANFTFNVALIAVPMAGQLKNIPKLAELGMNASKKLASKIPKSADDLGEFFKNIFGDTKGTGEAESSLNPKLEKYLSDSFEGTGKEVQDNFNKYLRENVWCDETLSNADKIDIMKANFDNLTPEQKVNFNVSNEVKVIKNPDKSNWGEWPDIDWPDFPGLNKDTAKSVYNEVTGKIEIPNDLDRLGSPYGNNLCVVENGYNCTQNERSICYIENEYARNGYQFDGTYYKDTIDAIKDLDISNPEESVNKINSIIDMQNKLNGTSLAKVDEADIVLWKDDYIKFQNNPNLIELCKEKGIDSTYGVMGDAEKWVVNGELITSGGAGQINTPVSVKTLEDIGLIKNVGGW